MQVTYTVYCMGFGDDENQWEPCGTYASEASAEVAAKRIVDDLQQDGMEFPAQYVTVEKTIVQ